MLIVSMVILSVHDEYVLTGKPSCVILHIVFLLILLICQDTSDHTVITMWEGILETMIIVAIAEACVSMRNLH